MGVSGTLVGVSGMTVGSTITGVSEEGSDGTEIDRASSKDESLDMPCRDQSDQQLPNKTARDPQPRVRRRRAEVDVERAGGELKSTLSTWPSTEASSCRTKQPATPSRGCAGGKLRSSSSPRESERHTPSRRERALVVERERETHTPSRQERALQLPKKK